MFSRALLELLAKGGNVAVRIVADDFLDAPEREKLLAQAVKSFLIGNGADKIIKDIQIDAAHENARLINFANDAPNLLARILQNYGNNVVGLDFHKQIFGKQ